MTAGDRVGILLWAALAAAGSARGQEAAPPAAPPAGDLAGVARLPTETPLSIRSASLLRSATVVRDKHGQVRESWPQLETVYDTPGSTRPSHRLELMRFGDDSSVLVTYKRKVPQLVWRTNLR